MSGLTVDVAWTYETGNLIQQLDIDYNALVAVELNANVCVDMFLSQDENDAASTTAASYEVMIWLGRFGYDALPLGYELGALDTRIIGDTTL